MNSVKAILCAFMVAIVLKLFFFDFMVAQGDSMEPAIQNGTVLVISRLRYGFRLPRQQKYLIRWAEPRIGDIVVFYTPAGELAVKRCIALTGTGSFIAGSDNELSSYDSRSYGQVSFDTIIGKVLER